MLLLTLFACNGDEGGTEPPPDFNYIPDYSDACLPTMDNVDDAISATADRVESDTFLVAHHLEICSEEMASSCAPCSTNPDDPNYNAMAHLVGEFDQWGSSEAKTLLASEGVTADMFPGIFADALAYPWRHLLIHGVEGGETITLSPGTANNCVLSQEQGGDGCGSEAEYRIALEALDADCQDFRNTTTGSFSSSAVTTTVPGAKAFGFQVPIVHPDDLRPVDDFPSVPELEFWLKSIPSATVRVDNPVVTVDGECGTIEGYLDPDTFALIQSSESALDAYRDASGGIPVTLTVELHPTTVETEVAP